MTMNDYYLVKLNDEQLALISRCLMSGPYGLVRPLIDEINHQIGEQRSGAGAASTANNEAVREAVHGSC